MPITTRCPECGTKYRLDEKHLDRQAKCKNGHVFKVIPEAQIVEDPQPVIPEETAVESVPRSAEPTTPQQAVSLVRKIVLVGFTLRFVLKMAGWW